MKLLRFDLVAFGSLSGTSLSLASEVPCLHLVYGPNEAGKSTALRALHGLFYGIPEATPDAHRFRPSELRVGGLLCDDRGRELYVLRRKGRKQTLTAADGRPLAGADASWITAGVSEAQFRSMFALSFDTLEEGADELLGSAGELGQSLFSAGTGGAGAHAVLEALRQEADAIYRPRGRTQRLNEALGAFEASKRAVREQAIRSEAFSEQQRAIDEAEADAGRYQLQRQKLSAERARLERARRVLPLLAKRAEYQRHRDELGDVALLPDSAGDERRGYERGLRDASLRIEHVERELAALDQELLELAIPPTWLAAENQPPLLELRDRLSQYRRAQRALPGRRHALARARDELTSMLDQLGLADRASIDALDRLRLSRPFEAKLREQARRGEALQQRTAALARQLATKRDDVARQAAALATLRGLVEPAAGDSRPTSRASRGPSRADAQIQLSLLGRAPDAPQPPAAGTDVLPPPAESPEPPPPVAEGRAPVSDPRAKSSAGDLRAASADGRTPSSAGEQRAPRAALRADQIDEFERAFAELEREQRILADKRGDEERTFEQVRRELDALMHAGEPPTEQQLSAAREARDRLSAALRGELRAGRTAAAEAQLDSLERETREADGVADRLRRDATRAGDYARLRAAQAASERQLQRLAAQALHAEDRANALRDRWRLACASAAIAVRTPAQMRAFLTEERAETVRLEQLEREAAALERELAAERAEQERWRASWHELATRVGCSADASIAEVEALLAGLHDLLARADAAKNEARAIDELAADSAAFEAELAELAARLAPDRSGASPEATAQLLLDEHATALRCAERRSVLQGKRQARRSELQEANSARLAAERELAALVRAARVDDRTQLEAAELASARARSLDAALDQLQAELFEAADGFDLGELEHELYGATPVSMSELQTRLQDVEDALERVELARDQALQTLESRRAGLALLRESRGAADAALDTGAHLENVRLLAQRYVRVRLARGVLAREIERYRERHTGPILRSASRLFAELTNGAWSRLEADFGDLDTPVLMCVRHSGERVGVLGLSAGTRDQLYLALRLASIEQLAAGRELLPLVMDDLLVHFDDDRARAALRALGAFARTTQVLLFTHHARLGELAREALAPESLRLHRLAPPALTSSIPAES